MKKINLYLAFFIAICTTVSAQTNHLKINDDIVMPDDSLESKALILSVDAFLSAAQNNSQNKWILPTERVETQILIDEIMGIQKSEKFKDDSFFKAYLTNIIPLEEDKYAVKVSYIGINENTAILRASFELIAHKANNSFLISSPLLRNTQNWSSKKSGNDTYYYPYTIDGEKLQQITDQIVFYDKKLKNYEKESYTEHYLCKKETNPLKLFGVEYKSDYNGNVLNTSWVSEEGKKTVEVSTESRLYGVSMHDLWHNRLRKVIARKKVHRRVDCYIATLYGGMWGKSWEELFPVFKEKFVVGKQVDWLEHKKNKSHIVANEHNVYTDDFIGALIVKKIEKEKGFDGVWELLLTKRTKDEDEYFAKIESLTGISKKNYNKEVSKLIKAEIKNLGI